MRPAQLAGRGLHAGLILTPNPEFTLSSRELDGTVNERISNEFSKQGNITLLERVSIGTCVEQVVSGGTVPLRTLSTSYAEHRKQRERRGTSSAPSQSGNHSFPQTLRQHTKTKRKKRRFLTRRTINSKKLGSTSKKVLVEVLRLRQSMARLREVPQTHAGARQQDCGHAKVGSTCSSSNTT